MPAPAVAALMSGDPPAAVEDLDGAAGQAHVDLLADQGVRHGVKEAGGLDVVVEIDPGEPPLGILVVVARQRSQGWPLDALEELAPADPETAHDVGIHALHRAGDRGVALGEREERLPSQPAEDVGLGEAHPCLDLGFVARLSWSRRQHADAVMGRHHAVAAVDLGVVERGLVDAALQVVRHDQARHAAEEAEHTHVRPDPVGQRLAPGRLGVGEARGAEHGDEDLGLAHHARVGIDDRHLLARVVDEHLVARRMMLTHHRREAPLELAEQVQKRE